MCALWLLTELNCYTTRKVNKSDSPNSQTRHVWWRVPFPALPFWKWQNSLSRLLPLPMQGIIKAEDFFSKKPEFMLWAQEVRKVNTDVLGQPLGRFGHALSEGTSQRLKMHLKIFYSTWIDTNCWQPQCIVMGLTYTNTDAHTCLHTYLDLRIFCKQKCVDICVCNAVKIYT